MYPVVAISAFLASWEAYVRISGIPNYILPGPSEILLSLVEYAATLYQHSLVTGYEVLLGYACSIVLGGLFAILVVWSSTLDKALMPLFLFSQTVSKIAVAPLFVVWLGFGLAPKVLVAFLISFFPVFISTTAGLKSVETEMIEMIQSMSASTGQVFRKVRIPTALPHFFAGAKVAVPFATVGAIVGEWMASDSGAGLPPPAHAGGAGHGRALRHAADPVVRQHRHLCRGAQAGTPGHPVARIRPAGNGHEHDLVKHDARKRHGKD